MTATVVHFVDSNTHGGCEEIVLSLLRGLVGTGWNPVLIHYDEPGLSRMIREVDQVGITRRVVPPLRVGNRWWHLREFVRQLNALRPSVFHAHLSWPLGCFHGLIAARLSGVRAVVATAHVFGPEAAASFRGPKRRLHPPLIHRYIAVSHEVKRRLHDDLQVRASKISIVHNGIQVNAVIQRSLGPLQGPLQEAPALPLVLTPARLHPQKGHADLLRAAALVPNAHFVLAGDGPERGALEDLVRHLGIESRVLFLGERDDVPQLLARSAAFVLPSLYEGLPVSVLEAMAVGTPVIATAVGGTDEVVEDGVTGVLVPPGNPARLAAEISRLIASQPLADQMSEEAKRRVQQSFSSDSMIRGVLDVYGALTR